MLTVEQFRELNSCEVVGAFERMIHLVSVVNDLDPFDVQEWDGDKLITEFETAQKKSRVSERYSNSITIEGVTLSLIPFESLRLGQFIDLEANVSRGFNQNIHKIASIIYLNVSGGGMYEQIVEPYKNVNLQYRSELIDLLPVNTIYGACKKYLTFRENFFNSYDLFNDEYEGVNPDELDDEERKIYEEEMSRRKKEGSNQWSTLLNILTNKDITKFDEVLDLNLFLAFNQVSWLKSN